MNNYKTKKVMKKLASLLTCICLILSTTACSQSKNYSSGNWGSKKVIASNKYVTKDIKVDNFKKISVAGSPDVTFTQKSGRPEVEVYTSDNIVDLLDIKVKDNTLYIGFKKDVNVSYKKLEVRVSAETLNGISVAGSGDVFLKNGLQTNDNLSINVAGSGDIKGSGIKCNDMKVSVAGSGDINADNITCNNLKVSVAGSGDMVLRNVTATGTEASVAGSGSATITGTTQTATYIRRFAYRRLRGSTRYRQCSRLGQHQMFCNRVPESTHQRQRKDRLQRKSGTGLPEEELVQTLRFSLTIIIKRIV